MSGHSKTGVSNTDDFMHRVLEAVSNSKVRQTRTWWWIWLLWTMSRAIIHLSKQKNLWEKPVNHLSLAWACHLAPIVRLPYGRFDQEWQSGLMEQWQAELLNQWVQLWKWLHSLAAFFSESVSEPSNSAMRQFDCQNTLDGLADTSIICPPVDEQLLGAYFSYLIQTSFLAHSQIRMTITEFKLKSRRHNSYEWNRLPSAEAYRALITLYQADKKHQNNSHKPIASSGWHQGLNKLQFHQKKCSIHCWQTLFGFQDMGCRWQRI